MRGAKAPVRRDPAIHIPHAQAALENQCYQPYLCLAHQGNRILPHKLVTHIIACLRGSHGGPRAMSQGPGRWSSCPVRRRIHIRESIASTSTAEHEHEEEHDRRSGGGATCSV